jgi:hypothetical protein
MVVLCMFLMLVVFTTDDLKASCDSEVNSSEVTPPSVKELLNWTKVDFRVMTGFVGEDVGSDEGAELG